MLIFINIEKNCVMQLLCKILKEKLCPCLFYVSTRVNFDINLYHL